ncbi:MAG: single-stranded DNA-binding protein [Candidatus Ratteibacteria bacterium]|nr:single-stranded DNA-binding protein [Candidatus Ratteibacteria bacterium]
MANLNKVFLIGNLTRDPELRYLPDGRPVCNFGIAINRVYMTANREKKEEVCFLRIVVWGKQGESCSRFLNKGRPVFVEGRLQSRSWETQSGEKRSALDVIAERVQFLGGRPGGAAAPKTGEEVEKKNETVIDLGSKNDEVPF